MVLDTEKLKAEAESLGRLLRGYKTLINSPFVQNNPALIAELQEGIANNERDLANTSAILAAVEKWNADDTPSNKKEIASQDIIDALKLLADDVNLVPTDFEPPSLLADKATVEIV